MFFKKTKKKRTKRQLIIRLVIYLAAVAALGTGAFFYIQNEKAKAEEEFKNASAEILSPALTETKKDISEIIQSRETLPEEKVLQIMDENKVIWKVGDIGECFDNIDALKGSEKFEPIGGYTITDKSKKALEGILEEFESRGLSVGFIVLDIRSGKGVAYNCDHEYFSASSVKGPYMVSLIANEPEALEENRIYFDTIAATSDNACYNYLFSLYGNEYFNKWCEEAGISLRMDGDYNYVYYSPRMLAKLWLVNYRFFITDKEYGGKAAWLFDHPGYSTIHTSLGDFYKTLTKSGWIDLMYKSMIDSGIVMAGDNPYLITLMTDYGGDLLEMNGITYELEKIHADITGVKSKLSDAYIEKKKKEYRLGYWWG